MAPAGRSAVLVALALLWCYSTAVSAGNEHFVERVAQSQRLQAQFRARRPDFGSPASDTRTRIPRLPMPPSLADAYHKAMSYQPKQPGVPSVSWQDITSSGRGSERDDSPPAEVPWSGDSESSRVRPAPRGSRPYGRLPPLLQSALNSDVGSGIHRHVKIIETPAGCNCSGVTAEPNRTSLSFILSRLPPLESARVDLYLPIISEPDSPRSARAASLVTLLALCAPGGVGRSMRASLSLKKDPHRPQWRHAIIGDRLAALLRSPSAAAAAAAAGMEAGEADEGQCLQVMLPVEGGVTLNRHGHQHAHLTTRPIRRRRS